MKNTDIVEVLEQILAGWNWHIEHLEVNVYVNKISELQGHLNYCYGRRDGFEYAIELLKKELEG